MSTPRTERRRNRGRREIDWTREERAQALTDRYCDRLENAVTPHRTQLHETDARYPRELARRWALEQERDLLLAGYEEAQARVRTLEQLLPVCGRCKKLRLDAEYREHVSRYLSVDSEAGDAELPFCPDCRQYAAQADQPGETGVDRSAGHSTGPRGGPDVISFRPIRFVQEKRNGNARA